VSSNSTNVAAVNLSVMRIAGADRVKFVHNYCTADIKKLPVDEYREAFFLNHKGKTVCHGFVIAREVDLLLVSTTKFPDALLSGLDRYLISSDVQLSDVTPLWTTSFVFGSGSEEALAACDLQVPQGNRVFNPGFRLVLQAELAGPGFLLLDPAEGDSQLAETLIEQGAVNVSEADLHQQRVLQQTPWCDVEITEQCLPQELRRDAKAISFTKGQETVARLDALGHVNRYLVGFDVLEGSVAVGDTLKNEGKKVGLVTSLAEDPDGNTIGLGFLRVEFTSPGNEVQLEGT